MPHSRLYLLILLAGCAKATYVGPIDGKPAYKIDCADNAACQQKARDVCSGPFEERTVTNAKPGETAIVAVCTGSPE